MTDSIKTSAAATAKPESLRANLSPQQGVHPSHASSVSSAPSYVMTLHRTLGNQAVGRLIQQSKVKSLPPQVVSRGQESGAIQAKLTINKPNDIYEQEADRVADQVMRMPEKEVVGNKVDSSSRIAQSEIQLKPG